MIGKGMSSTRVGIHMVVWALIEVIIEAKSSININITNSIMACHRGDTMINNSNNNNNTISYHHDNRAAAEVMVSSMKGNIPKKDHVVKRALEGWATVDTEERSLPKLVGCCQQVV